MPGGPGALPAPEQLFGNPADLAFAGLAFDPAVLLVQGLEQIVLVNRGHFLVLRAGA